MEEFFHGFKKKITRKRSSDTRIYATGTFILTLKRKTKISFLRTNIENHTKFKEKIQLAITITHTPKTDSLQTALIIVCKIWKTTLKNNKCLRL